MFDADVWDALPELLEELCRSELIRLAFIESLPEHEPRMLGGVSFIHPEYAEEACASGSTLPNTVFRAVLEQRKPLLSPTEIGKMNARRELHLMNFLGNLPPLDFGRPKAANFYAVSSEGYHFLHFGYAYRALWMEVLPVHQVQEMQTLGMEIKRTHKLPTGETSTLMCMTRETAQANPFLRRSEYFFPTSPRFHFSLREQRLLELSMSDMPDNEIADELHLSFDAIKKRWRSIYAKVDATDTELIRDADSGAGQRKALLGYLRMHLEELRPYSR